MEYSHIRVLCGPVGSGKTTYCNKYRQPGDVVIDLDLIFQGITGAAKYDKPPDLWPWARGCRDALLDMAEAIQPPGNVWILTGAPTPAERQEYADRFPGCSIHVFPVPVEECARRCKADPERSDKLDWNNLIFRWWFQYQARPGDIVEG